MEKFPLLAGGCCSQNENTNPTAGSVPNKGQEDIAGEAGRSVENTNQGSKICTIKSDECSTQTLHLASVNVIHVDEKSGNGNAVVPLKLAGTKPRNNIHL